MSKIYLTLQERMTRLQTRANMANATAAGAEVTSSIAFVKMAEAGTIDEVTATENAKVFEVWQPDMNYKKGDIRRADNSPDAKLVKCVQAHKSQADWLPTKTPALWSVIGDPAIEFNPWSQPVGAHDAYQKGDKVAHNNKRWVSDIDGNVWEPGGAGTKNLWKEVTN